MYDANIIIEKLQGRMKIHHYDLEKIIEEATIKQEFYPVAYISKTDLYRISENKNYIENLSHEDMKKITNNFELNLCYSVFWKILKKTFNKFIKEKQKCLSQKTQLKKSMR